MCAYKSRKDPEFMKREQTHGNLIDERAPLA